jgi:hypothetical protein
LADNSLSRLFPKKKKENVVYFSGDTVIAAFLSGSKLEALKTNIKSSIDLDDFGGVRLEEVEIKTVNYTWDLINLNGKILENDFENQVNKKKEKKY